VRGDVLKRCSPQVCRRTTYPAGKTLRYSNSSVKPRIVRSNPNLRGVHGSFALSLGYVVIAGMGGMVMDERDTTHDESEAKL
jgi:hypothetical protein